MRTVTLPPGWVLSKLGEAFEWGSGGTPTRTNPRYYGSEIPWAIIGDLTDGPVSRTATSITQLGLVESSAKWVAPGSVLLAMYGSIGKLGIAQVHLTTNQAIAFTRPNLISSEYLFYFLLASRDELINSGKGGTQQNISQSIVKGFPFLIAPLAEQSRIVEAIESYLTRLDDAVAALERVQRNLKRYRASVLKAAVEGRLVPTEAELARKENREYEPASVLLDRILKERKHRFIEDAAEKGRAKAEAKAKSAGKTWIDTDDEKTLVAERAKAAKKYRESVAPDASELPKLPKGWCWASVEQLGFIASGQTPQGVTTAGTSKGNIPWFRVGDMNAEGNETYMRIGRDWLTDAQIVEFGLHVRPPGTIIFPKRGGAIRTNKKRLLSMSSTYDLNTMGIVPVQPTGPYLWMWFMRLDLGSLSDGSNVPQLNHGDIAPLSVPLPPLKEQFRVIEEVERMISVQEAAAHVAGESVRRANRLRQSILNWAFEGKLIDQDPNDEPASALLERIKAERSASKAATRAIPSRRKRKTA